MRRGHVIKRCGPTTWALVTERWPHSPARTLAALQSLSRRTAVSRQPFGSRVERTCSCGASRAEISRSTIHLIRSTVPYGRTSWPGRLRGKRSNDHPRRHRSRRRLEPVSLGLPTVWSSLSTPQARLKRLGVAIPSRPPGHRHVSGPRTRLPRAGWRPRAPGRAAPASHAQPDRGGAWAGRRPPESPTHAPELPRYCHRDLPTENTTSPEPRHLSWILGVRDQTDPTSGRLIT
jgi:hypothetical protein